MKKTAIILLTAIILFSTSIPAFADTFISPWDKLFSGLKDFLTSPLELIIQPAKQMNENDEKMLGFLAGMAEGPAKFTSKFMKGSTNIITFPFYQ